MALSMDEQRILAEIESQLSDDDPRLAQRLSGFNRARRRHRIKRIVTFVIAVAAITLVLATVVVMTGF